MPCLDVSREKYNPIPREKINRPTMIVQSSGESTAGYFLYAEK